MPSYTSDTDQRHRRPEHRSTRPLDQEADTDIIPDKGASRRGDHRSSNRDSRRRRADGDDAPAARAGEAAGLTENSHRRSHRRDRSHSRSGSRVHRSERSRSPRPSRASAHDGRRRPSSRSRSRSPPPKRRRRSPRSRSKSPHRRRHRHSPDSARDKPKAIEPFQRSKKPLPSQELSFAGKDGVEGPDGEIIEKQKPNFGNSGILARETNTIAGTNIVLKYNEPAEARKPPPSQAWRLYIFKGEDVIDTIPLHTQSCWLLGRETAVVDLPVEHPSSSKQHAVIQFRHTTKVNEFGDREGKVRPYIIDLESSNGTNLNGTKIEPSRFVEVRTGDVMKIGLSEREYVFILPPPE